MKRSNLNVSTGETLFEKFDDFLDLFKSESMASFIFSIFFISYALCFITSTNGARTSLEQQLVGYVTSHTFYGRPVYQTNQTLLLSIQMEIAQFTVSTKKQTLSISGFFRMKWHNELVGWNRSEYGGIKTINVDSHQLWFPEVVLHNSVAQSKDWTSMLFKTKIKVDHTGVCYWLSPIEFESTCTFKVNAFPFDKQTCDITFGPWTSDVSKIFLQITDKAVITSQYTENAEWEIENVAQIIETKYYGCCPKPFRNLKITLKMRRKPSFYLFTSIVPASFLVMLVILGHWLPLQSGERITLTIMILLTSILMMEYTNSRILPRTFEISSLSKALLTLTVLSSLSILETCYVLSLLHTPKAMLKWLPKTVERMFFASPTALDRQKLSLGNIGKNNTTERTSHIENSHDDDIRANESTMMIYNEIKKYNNERDEDGDKQSHLRLQRITRFFDISFVIITFASIVLAVIIETLSK